MKKILGWIPRSLAGLIEIFKGAILLALIFVMILWMYITIPLMVIRAWLVFLSEGKTNKYWSRAWYEVKFVHNDVKNLIRSLQ